MTNSFAFLTLFCSGLLLWVFIKNIPKQLLLYYLFPGAILFYHGAGYITARFILKKAEYEWILSDAKIDEQDFTIAFIFIGLLSAWIFVVGRIFRRYLTIDLAPLASATAQFTASRNFLLLGFAGVGLESYLIITGAVGIGGILTVNDSNYVSSWAQFSYPMTYMLCYVTTFAIRSHANRTAAIVILVPQLFVAFIGGRRAFAVALFFCFFGSRVAGFKLARLRTVARMAFILVSGVLFYTGFQYYQAIRTEQLENVANIENLKAAFSNGLLRMISGGDSSENFRDDVRFNAGSRPFFIVYPTMLLRYSENMSGANGAVIAASIKTVFPHILWRGKAAFLYTDQSEERIAYGTFNLPRLQDETNTVITSGYTEMKYFGSAIYVVLIYTIIVGLLTLSRIVGGIGVYCYALFSIVTMLLTVEQCLSDWLLLARNTLLIISTLALMNALFGGRQHWMTQSRMPKTSQLRPPLV